MLKRLRNLKRSSWLAEDDFLWLSVDNVPPKLNVVSGSELLIRIADSLNTETFCFTMLYFQTLVQIRDEDPLDLMDPAAYSDVAQGT